MKEIMATKTVVRFNNDKYRRNNFKFHRILLKLNLLSGASKVLRPGSITMFLGTSCFSDW